MYTLEARMRCFKINKDKKKKVVIIWILRHAGIKGNEASNELVEVRTEEKCTKELKILYSDLKEIYKKKKKEKDKGTE